ncbi:hypothetical protein RFI_15763 [Reticulomyxa filosa]|uniref:Ubiquitin carboxyl-terminal hydrolase 7 ICP0-binding domain-containing protein n=1 Tax=Reticulomyxa filosa TaxID=46433 RepID=X6N614_RETFI|nr:hypothetical protein RFI_15763 [Reticulomyxa filosa]|eukprot:ETO21441.1 hypothetical protein RFI_15763 [Reticulomyxa filosa]
MNKAKNKEKDTKSLDANSKSSFGVNDRNGGITAKSEKLDANKNVPSLFVLLFFLNNKKKKDEDESLAEMSKNSNSNNHSLANYFSANADNTRIPSCACTRKKDDTNILLFLKYFDVYHQSMSVIGSTIISKDASIVEITQLIRKIANWSSEREVLLWEEEDCENGKIQPLEEYSFINDCQLVDGDIIIFQEKSTLLPLMHLPDAKVF